MKVTLLGTGSPGPMFNRASSGYLVEFGDEMLGLDGRIIWGEDLMEIPLQEEALLPAC